MDSYLLRVPALPDPHAGSPPVLPPCGPLVGQSELRSSPAQHDPDEREAEGAAGWAVLPVLTGEHTVVSKVLILVLI